MSHSDQISIRYPQLGRGLGRELLATLPTPVRTVGFTCTSGDKTITIKCDDLTGSLYGGNKVRKLEYALWPARVRGKRRIATFGAAGSHHALATALYAKSIGLDCTCFLSHQAAAPEIAQTLHAHLANETTIVRFGGAYAKRVAILREQLWRRDYWVIPAGGSSWRGTVGYVNAGLELASQIENGELAVPDRIYIATGTMGTAAGLAIGLAMAGLDSRVEAIRVSVTSICCEKLLHQLVRKTIEMMHRLDSSISTGLVNKVNIRLRHSFFAGGYAHRNIETDSAVKFAADYLGLRLETTYTGKAMAALLRDARETRDEHVLFWNTYNSMPLPAAADNVSTDRLPQEFHRYLTRNAAAG
jgi:1-aminocyclopropane-1-carboxylate deaminase/D-cysteine desulfhydrase-like pyridoxal-dependent ACC family enzyme